MRWLNKNPPSICCCSGFFVKFQNPLWPISHTHLSHVPRPHSAASRSRAAKSFNLTLTNHNHRALAHLLLSPCLWKAVIFIPTSSSEQRKYAKNLFFSQKIEPYFPQRKSSCVCLCPAHATVLRIRDLGSDGSVTAVIRTSRPASHKKPAQHYRLSKNPFFSLQTHFLTLGIVSRVFIWALFSIPFTNERSSSFHKYLTEQTKAFLNLQRLKQVNQLCKLRCFWHCWAEQH